jgi:hypothetical protein
VPAKYPVSVESVSRCNALSSSIIRSIIRSIKVC